MKNLNFILILLLFSATACQIKPAGAPAQMQSKPFHVGNLCFSPVHADTKTGKLIFINSYFYIGHFLKFVLPGAKRIVCSSNRDKLEATAFLNPDGKLVVVVLNKTDEKMPFNVWITGKAVQTNS